MSANELSAVLVNAMFDEGFRQHLLATPDEALTRFDLSPYERDGLASIRATTIEEFAAGMASWLSEGQPRSRRLIPAVSYAPIALGCD